MNCERAIALISARIDGELSPADEAALEAHLDDCPACAATAEAFELQDAEMRHAFDERRPPAARRQPLEALAPPPAPLRLRRRPGRRPGRARLVPGRQLQPATPADAARGRRSRARRATHRPAETRRHPGATARRRPDPA